MRNRHSLEITQHPEIGPTGVHVFGVPIAELPAATPPEWFSERLREIEYQLYAQTVEITNLQARIAVLERHDYLHRMWNWLRRWWSA